MAAEAPPFPAILGHPRVRRLLARVVAAGRVPSSLLLAGPEGVGKRTLAEAFARGLLCERGGPEPCEGCSACSRSARSLHPDLFLVRPDGASLKVEQMREVVREIAGRPFEGRARAFVLDDAHLMTEQAGNALLKSLEEPPASSHILLVTSSPQALLPTIRSRCQLLRFGPLPLAALAERLRDAHGLAGDEARLRAALSGGSLGLALSLDGGAYTAARDRWLAALESLEKLGPAARHELAEEMGESGETAALALTALRTLLRDVATLAAGGPSLGLVNVDREPRLRALAAGPLGARAVALGEGAGEARDAVQGKVPGQLKQGPAHAPLALTVFLDTLAPAPRRG